MLYSGSIGEKQGLDALLETAGRFAKNPRYRFAICSDGPVKEALASRYAHLDNVTWKPRQPAERLAELLAAADVHALPQRAGVAELVMPSKLLGMMASGKPVVAMAARDTQTWKVMEGRGSSCLPRIPGLLPKLSSSWVPTRSSDPAWARPRGPMSRRIWSAKTSSGSSRLNWPASWRGLDSSRMSILCPYSDLIAS